jgi:hypothetical protein
LRAYFQDCPSIEREIGLLHQFFLGFHSTRLWSLMEEFQLYFLLSLR